MKMYAEVVGAVRPEHVALLSEVTRVVRELPVLDFGVGCEPGCGGVTCHNLCRALAAELGGVECRDGYFTTGYQHSWLRVLGTSVDDPVIIDAYPVGGVVPFAIYVGWRSPWSSLYKPSDPWLQDKLAAPFLVEETELVRAAIKKLREKWRVENIEIRAEWERLNGLRGH